MRKIGAHQVNLPVEEALKICIDCDFKVECIYWQRQDDWWRFFCVQKWNCIGLLGMFDSVVANDWLAWNMPVGHSTGLLSFKLESWRFCLILAEHWLHSLMNIKLNSQLKMMSSIISRMPRPNQVPKRFRGICWVFWLEDHFQKIFMKTKWVGKLEKIGTYLGLMGSKGHIVLTIWQDVVILSVPCMSMLFASHLTISSLSIHSSNNWGMLWNCISFSCKGCGLQT